MTKSICSSFDSYITTSKIPGDFTPGSEFSRGSSSPGRSRYALHGYLWERNYLKEETS